jgi:hypothetical protein
MRKPIGENIWFVCLGTVNNSAMHVTAYHSRGEFKREFKPPILCTFLRQQIPLFRQFFKIFIKKNILSVT